MLETIAPTLIFLHGWPDDHRLWKNQISYFSKDYRCVALTLPGFDSHTKQLATDEPLAFSELVEWLAREIQNLQAGRRNAPVILVGHDFGAYLAYLFENRYPERVSRMVALDIGTRNEIQGLGHLAFVVVYQGWLISAWLMRHLSLPMADWMTRKFAKVATAPHPDLASVSMNYLYFDLWRERIRPKRFSRCPTLFLYGGAKPYRFHSKRWATELARRPGCEVYELRNAGHWLMRDQPDETNFRIERWLAQSK